MKKFILGLIVFAFPLIAGEIPRDAKVYVAGHRGLVGSAIMRHLKEEGFTNIITRTSSELDLRDQKAANDFFAKEKPEYVFLAAAKVGGILGNCSAQAEFLYNNLMIATSTIKAAHNHGVKRFINLGSSCIYPRMCPQPIKEEYLLTGALEETNYGYAIAKIAAIKLCKALNVENKTRFISIMPCNLYGPNDNYDPKTSHLFPAMIRKIVEAKENGDPTFVMWGTGSPKREFMHSDDVARASLFLMENYDGDEIVNIGWGKDISVLDFTNMVKEAVGYEGEIVLDPTKPDGTPRKIMDVSRLKSLGFEPKISLREGIERTVQDFLKEHR
ncbi:MAG: GDP-L-fucose synthase [Candidatus Algichlamydia australiensis]|nr:GDP-L-fucose synthase [Chlamydiales bacterium]